MKTFILNRFLIIIVQIVLFVSNIFAQKDSAFYCTQYNAAINYIKQDTLLKNQYHIKESSFKINKDICNGGIDPAFFEEYISYIFKKPFDSLDRKMIDSVYEPLIKNRLSKILKVKCLISDENSRLYISFCRENDTIFGVTVGLLKSEKQKLNNNNWQPQSGIAYLFILNEKGNIETVFKKVFW